MSPFYEPFYQFTEDILEVRFNMTIHKIKRDLFNVIIAKRLRYNFNLSSIVWTFYIFLRGTQKFFA